MTEWIVEPGDENHIATLRREDVTIHYYAFPNHLERGTPTHYLYSNSDGAVYVADIGGLPNRISLLLASGYNLVESNPEWEANKWFPPEHPSDSHKYFGRDGWEEG